MPVVVAITGASGAIYAARLLHVLLKAGRDVHLVVSPSGAAVIKQELGFDIEPRSPDAVPLLEAGEFPPRPHEWTAAKPGILTAHAHADFFTPIASGSFVTEGMVVCPCSGSTLASIAHGTGGNLIHRAADVHLKEGRKLILVPRETPLSLVHLDNMKAVCLAGGVILPASPGWYHGASGIEDLVDFVVARILDQLGVEHALMRPWGTL